VHPFGVHENYFQDERYLLVHYSNRRLNFFYIHQNTISVPAKGHQTNFSNSKTRIKFNMAHLEKTHSASYDVGGLTNIFIALLWRVNINIYSYCNINHKLCSFWQHHRMLLAEALALARKSDVNICQVYPSLYSCFIYYSLWMKCEMSFHYCLYQWKILIDAVGWK
jgi:hypothetical protein